MPFVIHKWSREPGSVSYNGPTCEKAGVVGGRVYDTFLEAFDDARKLSVINPIGFLVSELK